MECFGEVSSWWRKKNPFFQACRQSAGPAGARCPHLVPVLPTMALTCCRPNLLFSQVPSPHKSHNLKSFEQALAKMSPDSSSFKRG